MTDDDTGQLRLNVTDADLIPDDVADVIDLNKPRSRPPEMAPWQPVFDQTDDLDGLLTARGPLLSRAFGKRGNRAGNDNDARPAAPEGRRNERRSKGPKAV